MTLPNIDPISQTKPLGYDPVRGKFIYYNEIISGSEQIIPVETLSDADFKTLVIERLRSGPNFRMQSMGGPLYTRDQVIVAIECDAPDMRPFLDAEMSYLRAFIQEIKENL
jgi:hypothetical protein